jgi:hypothetical protein
MGKLPLAFASAHALPGPSFELTQYSPPALGDAQNRPSDGSSPGNKKQPDTDAAAATSAAPKKGFDFMLIG